MTITVDPGRRPVDRDPQATAAGDLRLQRRRRRPASTTPAGSPTGRWPFAVNQFDLRESDLAPRGLVPEGTPPDQADAYKIKIGYNPVAGTRRTIQAAREDWWKPLAVVALGGRLPGVVHLQPAGLHLSQDRSARRR